jgi:pyruvate kinase
MSLSQTKFGPTGPGLRGGNINLETILRKTDTSTRQSKIVCTLGPACWEVPMLEKLIDAGLAVARFNFSHGDHEGHKACLDRLREAATNKNKHVGASLFAVVMTRNVGRSCTAWILCSRW